MKPYSITRIGVALTLLILLAAMALTAYTWRQTEATALEIQEREREFARIEIREALAAQESKLLRIGRDLSAWDRTRAQLSQGGHYLAWRDNEAWGAGLLPCTTDALALYGPDGHILAPDHSSEAMPARFSGGSLPHFEASRLAGHEHLVFYHPVHGSGAKPTLLGYLGLRIDLLPELINSGNFTLIEPDSLAIDVQDGTQVDLRRLADQVRYDLRPSPYQQHFLENFWQTHVRLLLFILLTLAGVALVLQRAVSRPLLAMSRDIDTLNASRDPLDDHQLQTRASPILELERLRHSILDYRAHLARSHHHLEACAQKFEHDAYHDALTGSLNRRAFDEDMDNLGGMRASDHHALLLFDCDRFKTINDTYGHNVGDDVLRVVSFRLQEALRGEDRLYRLGGDEFVTLLPGAGLETARAIAERCAQQIRDIQHQRLGLAEPVSLSIGIAVDDGEGLSLSELHRRADMAMYRAKQSATGKIVAHDATAPGPA